MKEKISNKLNKIPAYILTPGCKLSRKNLNICVETPEKSKTLLRIRNMKTLVVSDPRAISAQVIELCARSGVTLLFINKNGRILSKVNSYNPLAKDTFSKQLDFINSDLAFSWAKFIVNRKITSQHEMLTRASYREKDSFKKINLSNIAFKLKMSLEKVNSAIDLNNLRGIEGHASKIYFSTFNDLVKTQKSLFIWQRRSRRPPKDSLNALISFLYSLALQVVESALTANSLDTSLGILHIRKYGRPSLSLDFLDLVRSNCDRLAFTLINRGQMDASCFHQKDNAVLLNNKGRLIILDFFIGKNPEQGLRNRIIFNIDKEAEHFIKVIYNLKV